MKHQYCKENSPLERLWREYQQMYAPDEDLPMCQPENIERYNLDLTLAMFGFGADTICRRKKEIEILRQELADIEQSHRDAMRTLPTDEETLGFFIPVLTECVV